MHGSHTHVGGRFDVRFIDIVSFIAHQASVSQIGNDNIIIRDLTSTGVPRVKSGPESQADIIQMSVDQPVGDWFMVFNNLDVPKGGYAFAALQTTLFFLILPESLAERFNSYISPIMWSEAESAFILDYYMPEIRIAVKNVSINLFQKIDICRKFIGMFIKIFYAFLWQEQFIPTPFWARQTTEGLLLASYLQP